MPQRNQDLHGSAPDNCHTALLLIDVINDFAFPEANQLLKFAVPMARQLRVLKQRAALLKSAGAARRGGDLSTLDVWDGHLAGHGHSNATEWLGRRKHRDRLATLRASVALPGYLADRVPVELRLYQPAGMPMTATRAMTARTTAAMTILLRPLFSTLSTVSERGSVELLSYSTCSVLSSALSGSSVEISLLSEDGSLGLMPSSNRPLRSGVTVVRLGRLV